MANELAIPLAVVGGVIVGAGLMLIGVLFALDGLSEPRKPGEKDGWIHECRWYPPATCHPPKPPPAPPSPANMPADVQPLRESWVPHPDNPRAFLARPAAPPNRGAHTEGGNMVDAPTTKPPTVENAVGEPVLMPEKARISRLPNGAVCAHFPDEPGMHYFDTHGEAVAWVNERQAERKRERGETKPLGFYEKAVRNAAAKFTHPAFARVEAAVAAMTSTAAIRWTEHQTPYRHWRMQSKTGAYWIVAEVDGIARAAMSFENDWRPIGFQSVEDAQKFCQDAEEATVKA